MEYKQRLREIALEVCADLERSNESLRKKAAFQLLAGMAWDEVLKERGQECRGRLSMEDLVNEVNKMGVDGDYPADELVMSIVDSEEPPTPRESALPSYDTLMGEFDSLLDGTGYGKGVRDSEQWAQMTDALEPELIRKLKRKLLEAEFAAFMKWSESLSREEQRNLTGKWVYVTGGIASQASFGSLGEAVEAAMDNYLYATPAAYVGCVGESNRIIEPLKDPLESDLLMMGSCDDAPTMT